MLFRSGVLIVALQIPVTRLIEHRDPKRLLVVSSLLAGYGFGLTVFAGSVGVFALTVCVWTLGEMINAPTQTGLVVRLSPVHGRGRYHKDLYLCHFYIPERLTYYIPAGWSDDLFLIDLHRLGHHPWLGRWWQLKDLAQLLYSSDVEGVTARGRLRFWRLYAGPGRRRGAGPWLRRGVLLRWRNYRRHHAARVARRAA